METLSFEQAHIFRVPQPSLVAQWVKNRPAMQEILVWFLGWEDPLEKGRLPTPVFLVFPSDSAGKESACNAGDLGWIPGSGRSPGGGHGNPLQYSGLENPHGQRSLVGYSPWGRKESDTTEWLSIAQHYLPQVSLHAPCRGVFTNAALWLGLVPHLPDLFQLAWPGGWSFGGLHWISVFFH